jgi:type VI secretion system secreted protein VgrG
MDTSGRGSEAQFLFSISGAPPLSVMEFTATEQLSQPYIADIQMSCDEEIDVANMLEKEALLTIRGREQDRHIHGIVLRFDYYRTIGSGLKRRHVYEARVVPFTQLLSLEQDCRIFQDKQVQEIVEDIFKDSKIPSDRYEFRLFNKEHLRRYCVQYRETDLAFINRILAEEGIYYFYEHTKDKHRMIFADDPVCYMPIAGDTTMTFKPASGLNPEKEVISRIDISRSLCSGSYTQTNYNFKMPSVPLETKAQSRDENVRKYEIYDYPGQYGETDRGRKLTKARMEGRSAMQEQAQGTGNCPRLLPGHTFKLAGHDFQSFNKEYMLVSVTHTVEQPQTMEEQAGSGGATYSNIFTAIPSNVPYHPDKPPQKPYIHGLQSATVVGPENEEIYVDEYGRVKVQFHWDRIGKKNEQSSCWLRCAQSWGGGGWGSMFIPRIGDEVLVSFMEGDPDWPIITGSAYNGLNTPLYDLPANKTRSTIKTRSYPNSHGYNELRFDDRAGHEEVFIHGEKDWNILIKNDKGQTVGHDETLTVINNRDKTVGVNQSETIGVNKTINVGQNHSESIEVNMTRNVGMNKFDTTTINSMETIGAAKELSIGGLYQISVGGVMNETVIGAKAEEVGAAKALVVANDMTEYVMGDRKTTTEGNLTRKVGKTHHIQAEEYILEAKDQLILKTANATIIMKPDSITIKGKKVAYPGPGGGISAGQKDSKEGSNWISFILAEEGNCEGMQCIAHFSDGTKSEGIFNSDNKISFQNVKGALCNKIELKSKQDEEASSSVAQILVDKIMEGYADV